jgi:hypothetical protein
LLQADQNMFASTQTVNLSTGTPRPSAIAPFAMPSATTACVQLRQLGHPPHRGTNAIQIAVFAEPAGSWNFLAPPLGEFIEVWPAQQRMRQGLVRWHGGCRVSESAPLLRTQGSHYTLILAGDHIYKMDYRALLNRHVAASADVTVACVPVPVAEATAFAYWERRPTARAQFH